MRYTTGSAAPSGAVERQRAGVSATDVVALSTEVVVTGVSRVDDPGHEYRFLDASGHWAGGTTRDDQVPLGRLSSTSVVRGMSGAPVLRCPDNVVVGVVFGRYNSSDAFVAVARKIVDDTQLAEIQTVLDSLGTDDSGESEVE